MKKMPPCIEEFRLVVCLHQFHSSRCDRLLHPNSHHLDLHLAFESVLWLFG